MIPFARMLEYGNVSPIIKKNGGVRTQFNSTVKPTGRNHCAYAYDIVTNSVYVYGGITSLNDGVNELWKFNCSTRVWTSLRAGMVATYGSAMAVYNGKLYLYGGSTPTVTNNNFYIYDIGTNTWSLNNTSIGKPNSQLYCKLVSGNNGQLYLWGAPVASAFYSYNISTDTWGALTSCPFSNSSMGDMCYDGTTMYCINGGTGTKYNISTGTWSPFALFSPEGGRILYNTRDSHLYGFRNNVGNLYYYDSVAVNWVLLNTNTPISVSTGVFCYNAIGDDIYYLLGYDNGRSNDEYVYN